MNMYKYVCVNLVLLKGSWQFWKLKACLCQESAVEESSTVKMCVVHPWCDLGCVLRAAPPGVRRAVRSARVWGPLTKTLVDVIPCSLKRLWMWFSKHTCGRLLTHEKCVLGNFTWMLTSSPGRKMPLDQYLTLYKTLPLNDSNTCVFMRSNGGEGSKTESCTFYYMSRCSCNN